MNPTHNPSNEAEGPETPELSKVNFSGALERLLRSPLDMLRTLQTQRNLVPPLIALVAACLLVFGLVLGGFSAGPQLWQVPLKVIGGLIVAASICFPSFYIFSCLANAPLKLGGLFLAYLCFISLLSILLLAFAPILWVFAQSSNSVFFVGALVIACWLIAFALASRLLVSSGSQSNRWQVRLWLALFLLVSFQMSTALRPLLGPATTFFPKEKLFFLQHWSETALQDVSYEVEKQIGR